MKKIVIWCSPGTGSTLLSMTLHNCGMCYGNEATYYIGSGEHALITAMNGMSVDTKNDLHNKELETIYEKMPGNGPRDKFRNVLKNYISQAINGDWQCFGVKTTTGHYVDGFFELIKIYEEEWGKDIIWFTTVRHPLTALRRLSKWKNQIIPNENDFEKNWLSHIPLKLALIQLGAKVVEFPNDWESGKIVDKIESIGLGWTEEASVLFKPGEVQRAEAKECEDFLKRHPAMDRAYQMILEVARQ